jgi:hypothetical protein
MVLDAGTSRGSLCLQPSRIPWHPLTLSSSFPARFRFILAVDVAGTYVARDPQSFGFSEVTLRKDSRYTAKEVVTCIRAPCWPVPVGPYFYSATNNSGSLNVTLLGADNETLSGLFGRGTSSCQVASFHRCLLAVIESLTGWFWSTCRSQRLVADLGRLKHRRL